MPVSAGARNRRPVVGMAFDRIIRDVYVQPRDYQRLEEVAEVRYQEFSAPVLDTANIRLPPPRDLESERALGEFCRDLDALLICHGSPYVNSEVLAGASSLTFLGEIEGDKQAQRFDFAAAASRNMTIVDATQGSSLPTAEWTLGLALVGLRNAGTLFGRLCRREKPFPDTWNGRVQGPAFHNSELTGRSVGLVGFGRVARYLTRLLEPFDTRIIAYDPFVPRDLAEAFDVDFAPLHKVMEQDVVFCLLPLTSSTKGLIDAEAVGHLRSGSVFVSAGRGRVVDSRALLDRIRQGDISVALDVFDPEPIPLDSDLFGLENVFVTPHIAGDDATRRGARCFSLVVDDCLRHFDGVEPRCGLDANAIDCRK